MSGCGTGSPETGAAPPRHLRFTALSIMQGRDFGCKQGRARELQTIWIRNHLEMAAQERVERGAVAEDATYAARREFGNVELVKEVTRDIRGWRWLEDLAQDVETTPSRPCWC